MTQSYRRLHVIRAACWLLGCSLTAPAAAEVIAQSADLTAPPIATLLPSPPSQAIGWDRAVTDLIDQHKYDEADQILKMRLKLSPKDIQAQFMRGMVAMAREDYGDAINHFRGILIDHPNATRVRLELGRAFYADKDFSNSERQFQFALAGNPPPDVVKNINAYLGTIRRERSWNKSFSLALAPDSNVNTGSSAREVSLWGIPFDLSEDARQKSGIGLSLEAATEYAPKIGKNIRLRMGAHAIRREYIGKEFDDMVLSLHAGPRYFTETVDISLLATANRRWYGGRTYYDAVGARVEGTYYLNPRLGLNGAVSAQTLDYPNHPWMAGELYSASSSFIYALSQSSGVTFKAGASRQTAQDPAYASVSAYVAAGYFRDLPKGFSVYAEPSYSHATYDEPMGGFDRARVDNTQSMMLAVLNRHIVLSRFTPRLTYSYTRQNSSIELYQYRKHRMEMGLTTNF